MKLKGERLTGSGNWTVPTGVAWVWVTLVGGGGGGGGGVQLEGFVTYSAGSGGGGGGAESWENVPYRVAGQATIAYSVGIGGVGGGPGIDTDAEVGEAGGDSTFGTMRARGGGSPPENNGTIQGGSDCVFGYGAAGGGALGGARQPLGASAGNEPDDCDGTWRTGGCGGGSGARYTSLNGGRGASNVFAGGLGGSGQAGGGGAPTNINGGGGGGASAYGAGGRGCDYNDSAGDAGSGYGSGGGGGSGVPTTEGTPGTGGDGAPGTIVVVWISPS